ncbi:MAG: flavoprotein [Candidatus Euphemobacter frigidus]|nr:flavoprotein [Candidatus Euphemobacter frigidus]MDP8276629.1 flavoprotein [Candidatus Euphemobacter frigidus]
MKNKNLNAPLSGSTVVLGVTGSIAAYKAADLASRLKQMGAEVYTVMTPAAREFIAPLTFETLTGNRVYSDMFGEDQHLSPVHISLAQLSDLTVVAPATADFIGKVAGGLAVDLLSSVVMATRSPILLAPAMNSGMYENRIVQENIGKLTNHGIEFIGPESGYLACGYEGLGRLAAIDTIIAKIEAILSF